MNTIEAYIADRSYEELVQICAGHNYWREHKQLHPTDDYFGMHTQEVFGDTRASSLITVALLSYRQLCIRLMVEKLENMTAQPERVPFTMSEEGARRMMDPLYEAPAEESK